ncbi:hypothetical protein ANCDUO_24935 [Ancylostoma duodenale]|uniref:Reverse transcriptase domain-containing protein n=1 Tax=Ancylostoma duodenale TaxID=51022 RepID=A0A0C2FJH6_9BILA|nr:hypothetical protein ANCDUO_24935 [Ancylostoma duodenale]
MRPLLRKWRFSGVNIAVYLDDGIVWAHSAHSCEEAVSLVRTDLINAGFSLAEEKCSWTPLQRNEEAVEGSGFGGGRQRKNWDRSVFQMVSVGGGAERNQRLVGV